MPLLACGCGCALSRCVCRAKPTPPAAAALASHPTPHQPTIMHGLASSRKVPPCRRAPPHTCMRGSRQRHTPREPQAPVWRGSSALRAGGRARAARSGAERRAAPTRPQHTSPKKWPRPPACSGTDCRPLLQTQTATERKKNILTFCSVFLVCSV